MIESSIENLFTEINNSNEYKEYINILNILKENKEVNNLIEELRKLVYNKDVITMLQDGLFKVLAGFTTTDEILKLIEVEDEDFGVK